LIQIEQKVKQWLVAELNSFLKCNLGIFLK